MCAILTHKVFFFVVVVDIAGIYIVDTEYCHHFNRHTVNHTVTSSSMTWSSLLFMLSSWTCSWCSRLLSDGGDYHVCIDCIIKINIHIHPIVSISLFDWWMNPTVIVINIVIIHIVGGNSLSLCCSYSYYWYSYWCWYYHICCYCYCY